MSVDGFFDVTEATKLFKFYSANKGNPKVVELNEVPLPANSAVVSSFNARHKISI